MTDICSAKGCQQPAVVGAALEQPEAAHPRPPQGLARVRRPQGSRCRTSWAPAASSRRSSRTSTGPTSASRSGPAATRSSAADGRHRPVRLEERRVVDAVAGPLGRTSRRTQRSAISSSVAPARSAARRSDSSRANRQLRTWPSAVSRTRSQSPQNGRVTEAMTPTVAGPPSTRNSSAGALPRGSSAGRQHELAARSGARISSAVTIAVAAPAVLGVERHLLDEAQLVAARRGTSASSSGAWSSLTPRSSTALILTGPSPAALGRLEAGEDVVRAGRAG